MKTIFHITLGEEWEQAKFTGNYRAQSLDAEGFIHCSTLAQVIKVANRFFYSQKGLVLLCIDSEQVESEIRYETAEVNEEFPHIYGYLNVDAVYRAIALEPGEDGLFELPSTAKRN